MFSVKQLKDKITLMTRFTTGHDHVIKAKFIPDHIITIGFLVKFPVTFQSSEQLLSK
jgi:hypothetical protein